MVRIFGRSVSRLSIRSLIALISSVAVLTFISVVPAEAVHDVKVFQLDGDANSSLPSTPPAPEDWDLICKANQFSVGTLNADITASATSIAVNETKAPHIVPFNIQIDNEQMTVTGRTGTSNPRTYTVTRHFNGTTAAMHLSGASVISGCLFNPGYAIPSGSTKASPSSFIVDPSTSATDDILKGGTKDDNDMNSWKWTSAKPSPPKNDLTDGYAAEYTCNSNQSPLPANNVPGCTGTQNDSLLYFGADRFSINGAANIAFWFFHKKVVQKSDLPNEQCSLSSGCDFVGSNGLQSTHTVGNCSLPNHPTPCTPGDILVISAFGPHPLINVYEWVGPGKATHDYLGTTQCFTAACSLEPLATGGQDCTTLTGSDNACAVANSSKSDSPWPLPQDGKNNDNVFQADPVHGSSAFFEGGINLTQLKVEGCFSSFLVNTRASAAGDAELHDKLLGQFARCAPHLTTQSSTNATNVQPGTPVTDRATLQVTGAASPDDAVGTVQFYLCGPISGSDVCTSTSNPIGTPVTLSNADCSPVSTSDTDGKSCAVSLSVNDSGQTGARGPLGPGRYCWGATASLTNYDNPDAAPVTNECFSVAKFPSRLDTAPWFFPNDKATVHTAAGDSSTDITGSVSFRLFGATTISGVTTDAATNCANDDGTNGTQGLLYRETVNLPSAAATSKTVNTSNYPGGSGTPSTGVKVENTAVVYWRVSYGGDTLHIGRNSTCVENINATLTGDTGGTAP